MDPKQQPSEDSDEEDDFFGALARHIIANDVGMVTLQFNGDGEVTSYEEYPVSEEE